MPSLSLERAIETIEVIKKRLDELDQRLITAQQVRVYAGLSDISPRLGLVDAGEFRAGNNKEPGFGFSGVRIAYPAMSYAGGTWHIGGISNDTLQFGLDADTGKAYFGGGVDVIDAFGIHVYDAGGKPAFIALSAAETINSEALGAGDVLIGDNTVSKGNLFWDQSAGQIKIRSGTTITGYIDTDGDATFGAGAVRLDENGIAIDAGIDSALSINRITWYNPQTAAVIGAYDSFVVDSLPRASGSLSVDITDDTPTDTIQTTLNLQAASNDTSTNPDTNTNVRLLFTSSISGAGSDAQGTIEFIFKSNTPALNQTWDFVKMLGGSSHYIHFNPSTKDVDFIVSGDTNTNLIYADAAADAVAIGAPIVSGNILLDVISTTKAFRPPVMTTTQRDAVASPLAGMIIWNSTTGQLEDHNGTAWAAV